MIQFIAEMVSWTYDVRADAIVVSKSGGSFTGRSLETEFYEVTQGTIQRMTGGAEQLAGAEPTPLPHREEPQGVEEPMIQASKSKPFLRVPEFPLMIRRDTSLYFDGFQMIVTHERRFLGFDRKNFRETGRRFQQAG